jgi:hypothetical protein
MLARERLFNTTQPIVDRLDTKPFRLQVLGYQFTQLDIVINE